jgi:EpsI family protein
MRALFAAGLLLIGLTGEKLCRRLEAEVRGERTVELARSLTEFPRQMGLWAGRDLPVDPKIHQVIGGDAYLQRLYVHPSGQQCVLWMSFSKQSKDQYHFPTVCMTGSGWAEEEAARDQLLVKPREADCVVDAYSIYRMLFQKQGNRQLVYYWYYLIGEDAVDRFMRGQSDWARAFIRGRKNASVTVEVFSRSSTPDPRLLDDLVRQVAEELDRFVPKGTQGCCDLGAL